MGKWKSNKYLAKCFDTVSPLQPRSLLLFSFIKGMVWLPKDKQISAVFGDALQ